MVKNESGLLGVKIDNLTKKEILEKVSAFLSEPKFHQIATVNPEFVLEAQKNEEFKIILNGCDLNLADGIGIRFAFWRQGKKIKHRMAGIDLMEELLRIAEERRLHIFLAANKAGLSSWEETRSAILRKYPNLEIIGANLDKNDIPAKLFSSSEKIENGKRDYILFVNFGIPYQEIFINKAKCANIRVAMGVGGSFDYLTGKVKRAPVFARRIGLEWLFRLFWQPKRWKRIWNAVVVFPVKIIFRK